jgi:hypothetical protein
MENTGRERGRERERERDGDGGREGPTERKRVCVRERRGWREGERESW